MWRGNGQDVGKTHAFGGLGVRSTFFNARISSLGSAQCSSGLSPGTARLESSGVKDSERAETLAARRAEVARERSFMVWWWRWRGVCRDVECVFVVEKSTVAPNLTGMRRWLGERTGEVTQLVVVRELGLVLVPEAKTCGVEVLDSLKLGSGAHEEQPRVTTWKGRLSHCISHHRHLHNLAIVRQHYLDDHALYDCITHLYERHVTSALKTRDGALKLYCGGIGGGTQQQLESLAPQAAI